MTALNLRTMRLHINNFLVIVCLAAWATLTAAGQEPKKAPQPHMVVFIADDLGLYDSTPYGARDVHTPNMQQLADTGCTFTQAFVASPSCAPSRAALLTGLMPARNGAEANHTFKKDGILSLPEVMRKLGYTTAAFGKVAHNVKDANRHGFDHISSDSSALAIGRYLEERDRTRPLLLMVGTRWPHVPWPSNDGYDPESIRLPPGSIDTPITRQTRCQYYTAVTLADRDLGQTRDLVRKHLGPSCIFLFTSDHGAQWPFGKWNLYDAGIRVPLLIYWPGVIPPGSKSHAQIQWIDILPTLIEIAGGQVPSGLDGRSFAGLLKGQAQTHRDRIFATHTGDGNFNVTPMRCLRRDGFKYIRNLYPNHEYHTHIDVGKEPNKHGAQYWSSWLEVAMRDLTAGAIIKRYHIRPAEELYDLTADPHEQKNLAHDPHHVERLRMMRQELDEWMTRQGDKGEFVGTPRMLKE